MKKQKEAKVCRVGVLSKQARGKRREETREGVGERVMEKEKKQFFDSTVGILTELQVCTAHSDEQMTQGSRT